jgi:diaminopimelate decarboxylase
VVELATQYETPLYLYEQATLEATVAEYRLALERYWPGQAEVAYAAKAWLSTAMAQWAAANGLGMDVVSEGELRHALYAGFPAAQIHAHGNNKSDSFLRASVKAGVGRVVLNPATAPLDTHVSIQTGHQTSKFGLGIADGSASWVANYVEANRWLDWRGLHFHIGSQFTNTLSLCTAASRLLNWCATLPTELRRKPTEFSPGGGWAVPYTPNAPYLSPTTAIRDLSQAILRGLSDHDLPLPTLILEPGRELVARAGVALYTVGGLADNPRPALYGATYHALLANRTGGSFAKNTHTLAGPFCESGDTLIREIALPDLQENDLIAIPVSGAYQLSMASTYNGNPRPAVLWLHEGKAQVVQRRETIEELWIRDRSLT